MIKGWVYVSLSAIIIYIMSKYYLKKLAQTNQRLQTSYDELAAIHEELSAIFNASSDAIIVHDAETAEVINVNGRAMELFGATLEEIKQIGIAKIDGFCNASIIEIIKSAHAEGSRLIEWSAVSMQGEHLRLEGNYRRVTIHGADCVLAVIRDVTERKKMEAELAHVQIEKLALLKAIPDLILRLDKQGVHLDCHYPINFGPYIPSRDLLGKNIFDIFPADIARETC